MRHTSHIGSGRSFSINGQRLTNVKTVLPLVSACTIGQQATFILHPARSRGCMKSGRTSQENQSTVLVQDRCSKSP